MVGVCLLALSAGAQQPGAPADAPAPEQQAEIKAAERHIILLCTSDAYNSLHIAATYFEVVGRSEEKTAAFARQAGPAGEAIVKDLFAEVAAGTVRNAARFATVRLFNCLEAHHFPMDAGVKAPDSDLCWARSEVIHHSGVLKAQQKPREEALLALKTRFANAKAYPPSFLEGINNLVYARDSDAAGLRDTQKSFYWSCLRSGYPDPGSDGAK